MLRMELSAINESLMKQHCFIKLYEKTESFVGAGNSRVGNGKKFFNSAETVMSERVSPISIYV